MLNAGATAVVDNTGQAEQQDTQMAAAAQQLQPLLAQVNLVLEQARGSARTRADAAASTGGMLSRNITKTSQLLKYATTKSVASYCTAVSNSWCQVIKG